MLCNYRKGEPGKYVIMDRLSRGLELQFIRNILQNKGTCMNELIPQDIIEKRIYVIRRQKVMIDRELAELYEVETRALNQAVKRNIRRFPSDFMFSLTREEIMNLSQIVISSKIKHAPNVFAFTEQGVAMLSSVLKSERAVQVNIAIMRAFVNIRRALTTNKNLGRKLSLLEKRIDEQDGKIYAVFEALNKLISPPETKKRRIGFLREKEK